jgi:hypothetical protein
MAGLEKTLFSERSGGATYEGGQGGAIAPGRQREP